MRKFQVGDVVELEAKITQMFLNDLCLQLKGDHELWVTNGNSLKLKLVRRRGKK